MSNNMSSPYLHGCQPSSKQQRCGPNSLPSLPTSRLLDLLTTTKYSKTMRAESDVTVQLWFFFQWILTGCRSSVPSTGFSNLKRFESQELWAKPLQLSSLTSHPPSRAPKHRQGRHVQSSTWRRSPGYKKRLEIQNSHPHDLKRIKRVRLADGVTPAIALPCRLLAAVRASWLIGRSAEARILFDIGISCERLHVKTLSYTCLTDKNDQEWIQAEFSIYIRSHDFFGSLWKGPAPTGCNCRFKQLVAAACCDSMASWNCFCLSGQAEFKKRQPSESSTFLAWKSLMKKWHETTTLAISGPFCLRVCILGAVLNTHCSHRLCLRIGWGDKI